MTCTEEKAPCSACAGTDPHGGFMRLESLCGSPCEGRPPRSVISPQRVEQSRQIVCAILTQNSPGCGCLTEGKENSLEDPRRVPGSRQGGFLHPFPAPPVLEEILVTAPVLGWLTAQALYVAEPLLEAFLSPRILAKWSHFLEGEEEAR